jgi:hypothetical protein
MSFMWSVGINITSTILLETPVAVGGYGFGPKSIGFLYFTPLVAVGLGESFGHFFNDAIAKRYVVKHNGVFKPEARLVTSYIAAAFMIPGLIIVGQTLEKHLHYAGIVMGWGMYVFGVMLATVAITAYALDSYGSASSEVSGLLNFARGTSANPHKSLVVFPWATSNSRGARKAVMASHSAFKLLSSHWLCPSSSCFSFLEVG